MEYETNLRKAAEIKAAELISKHKILLPPHCTTDDAVCCAIVTCSEVLRNIDKKTQSYLYELFLHVRIELRHQ